MLSFRRKNFLIPASQVGSRQCHASTLVTLPGGDLLVAWFAGRREGQADTAIWLARQHDGHWLAPYSVAASEGVPHWNPVLFSAPDGVWLFFKIGPSVHQWRTHCIRSRDNGYTWDAPVEMVKDDPLPRGPSKNKLLIAADGTWLAPGSVENDRYWDVFVDRSTDNGQSWNMSFVPLVHQTNEPCQGSRLWQGLPAGVLWKNNLAQVLRWDGVIQPSLWESTPGHLHMLMRSTRGWLYRSDSTDNGRTWCTAYATTLPSNNSGIDLVKTDAGSLVLACNPVKGNWGVRTPLALIVSRDNGKSWSDRLDVENEEGEFSYPALISTGSSLHLTYTWNRENIAYCDLRAV